MSADDELYFTFDLGENNSIDAEFDIEENNSIDANFNIYAAGTTWGSISGNLENQTDLKNVLDTMSGAITSNHNEITSLTNTIQTYGDIVTYDAADFATSNQGILASTALQPGDNITRLTNNAGYITASALNGYATEAWVNNKGYITGITSNDVITALGYTPYNNTNPRGFITSADLPTLEDLTTTAQLSAINSGATTVLINQITTNKNAITNETANRQNADNNLQSQIDAITSASDVTDIVGTYAQLQAYDTSSLPPNSIIKVLQDESQNNETTYYRWVITGGVGSWVLIGEEGPYYTKSESDSIFVPQTRTINGKPLSNNITLAIPTDTSELTNGAGYITGITSTNVINALGYTPYDSANPNGYTSNVGTVTSVNNTQPDSNGNVTINIPSTANLVTTNTNQSITGTKAFNTITTDSQYDQLSISTQATANILNYYNSNVTVGDSWYALKLQGSATRPVYNNDNLALYSDIPTVNDSTITFTQGGVTKGTITLNQSGDPTIALDAGGGGGGSYTAGNGIDITNDTISIDTSVVATQTDIANMVTTNTAQDISGVKTFLGEKAIHFKQSATTDKLGFTLYNPSDAELGAFEYRPNTINGKALLSVNCSYSSTNYVGFRYWGISGSGAANIVAPRVATSGDYYIPIQIRNNGNDVGADNRGICDISSIVSNIDDTTSSTTTVYSSQKTQDLIDALVARIVALETNINGGNA